MRPETEPWWRQSRADMATGRVLVESESYYASAWFAHQAAEKGLKALFTERHGRQAARTHDLMLLATVLAVAASVNGSHPNG